MQKVPFPLPLHKNACSHLHSLAALQAQLIWLGSAHVTAGIYCTTAQERVNRLCTRLAEKSNEMPLLYKQVAGCHHRDERAEVAIKYPVCEKDMMDASRPSPAISVAAGITLTMSTFNMRILMIVDAFLLFWRLFQQTLDCLSLNLQSLSQSLPDGHPAALRALLAASGPLGGPMYWPMSLLRWLQSICGHPAPFLAAVRFRPNDVCSAIRMSVKQLRLHRLTARGTHVFDHLCLGSRCAWTCGVSTRNREIGLGLHTSC